MNAEHFGLQNNASFLIGVLFMAISLGWAVHTAWRTRGIPLTREAQLAQQVAALQKHVAAQDEQINLLLEDRVHDRERIRVLETELAELKREAEHYITQRPTSRRSTPSYAPKRLTTAQRKELLACLLDAYPTREQWEVLLQDAEHPLALSDGDTLPISVSKTLTQAQAEGWLVSLIREAKNQRPALLEFQQLAATLLDALGADA